MAQWDKRVEAGLWKRGTLPWYTGKPPSFSFWRPGFDSRFDPNAGRYACEATPPCIRLLRALYHVAFASSSSGRLVLRRSATAFSPPEGETREELSTTPFLTEKGSSRKKKMPFASQTTKA